MVHGTEGYFLERARFERRLTLVYAVVSLVLLGALDVMRLPPLHRALRGVELRRFGYEGPDQYVRRIIIESSSEGPEPRHNLGPVEPMETRRGGARVIQSTTARNAEPVSRRRFEGPGESDWDMIARARALYPDMPVIRSQELVIEKLVRPRYPEEAREKGVEGKVALVARVDTTGRVIEVQVMGGSGESQLELASTEAVWRCQFRPYKVDGETREVYALFRFSFRLY